MPRRGALLALLVLLVSVAGVPVTSLAHPAASVSAVLVSIPEPLPTEHSAESRRSSPRPPPAGTFAAAELALGLTLILLGHRGRRLVAFGLVLVLTLIAFEGAVHSVHHVGDPPGVDQCRIAALAERVSATGAERPPTVVPVPPPPGPVPIGPFRVADRVSFAAAAGRAPPA